MPRDISCHSAVQARARRRRCDYKPENVVLERGVIGAKRQLVRESLLGNRVQLDSSHNTTVTTSGHSGSGPNNKVDVKMQLAEGELHTSTFTVTVRSDATLPQSVELHERHRRMITGNYERDDSFPSTQGD